MTLKVDNIQEYIPLKFGDDLKKMRRYGKCSSRNCQ